MSEKHYWSVYRRKTDTPAMIHGTAEECADAMHLKSAQTFYEIKCHVKNGKNRKWEIFEDDEDD